MPRPFSSTFISDASERLGALADAGQYLDALSLLRSLKESLVRCHAANVPVERIWMELSEKGAVFTRQHFLRAHRLFLQELDLKPQRLRTAPKRPDLPPNTLPRPRKLPSSKEITRAVDSFTGNESSLHLITKDL